MWVYDCFNSYTFVPMWECLNLSDPWCLWLPSGNTDMYLASLWKLHLMIYHRWGILHNVETKTDIQWLTSSSLYLNVCYKMILYLCINTYYTVFSKCDIYNHEKKITVSVNYKRKHYKDLKMIYFLAK